MKTLSFVIFISLILIVLSGAGYYIYLKLTMLSPWLKQHSNYVIVTLAFFIILQMAGPLSYRIWPNAHNIPFILQWLTYVTLGFFSCFFFYFLFAEVLNALNKTLFQSEALTERRIFLGISILSLINITIGLKQALSKPTVEKIDIPLPLAFSTLAGLKIAQISDLHVGPTIRKSYVTNVLEATMSFAPDLIVLTGDMADGHPNFLADDMQPLSQLKAQYGVYYVTGNHEYYWSAPEWIECFESYGFIPLLNRHKIIEYNSTPLAIVGVSDLKAHQFFPDQACDPKKALENIPKDTYSILLAHQPNTYKIVKEQGLNDKVHLQLSGHTHGGQFFPWSIAVAFAQKYLAGLYHEDNTTHIYVNRGTGYWGPPFRMPKAGEVTHLTLTRPV